jgi:hypothetical protein
MADEKLDQRYLESLAKEEHAALMGRLVRVRAINGYADGIASDTFDIDVAVDRVVVRVLETHDGDLDCWMDEWLDPVYPVEIVERGGLPESLHACWIYGNSRSLGGGFEPGDICAMADGTPWIHIADKPWRINVADKPQPRLDPHEIAKALGGEVCDPPPRYGHLMGLMRNWSAERRSGQADGRRETIADIHRRNAADDKPCPICGGIEGCAHPLPDRQRVEAKIRPFRLMLSEALRPVIERLDSLEGIVRRQGNVG